MSYIYCEAVESHKKKQFSDCWRKVGKAVCFIWLIQFVDQVLANDNVIFEFDIPEQSLVKSLIALSNQSKTLVLYPYDLVENRVGSVVKGEFSVQEALHRILKNTDLVGSRSKTGVLMITEKESFAGNNQEEESMNNNKTLLATLMGLVVGAGAGQNVIAQQNSTNEYKGNTIEEIMVTATRRAEALSDVSAAISAVTGDTLENRNIDGFLEASRSIPGLSSESFGPGRQKYTIRGINATGGEPTVGFYLGEIPMVANIGTIRQVSGDPKLTDLNRVEVLRGPQGTLYGASSMGGTIRLMPNEPDAGEFSAKISAGFSSTASSDGTNYLGDFMVNIPLAEDVAALRLNAWHHDNAGFIDRGLGTAVPTASPFPGEGTILEEDLNDEETSGFRVALKWDPSDAVSLLPSIMHQKTKIGGFQDITVGDFNPSEEFVQLFPEDLTEPFVDEWTTYSLEANFQIGNIDIISATSLFDREFEALEEGNEILLAFDVAPAAGSGDLAVLTEGVDTESLTQELRFSTIETWNGFHLLAGLFYQDAEYSRFVGWAPEAYGDLFTNFETDKKEQRAVFGEISYELTEDIELTFGARWFDYELYNIRDITGLFNGGATVTITDTSDSDVNMKFNASWHLNEDKMIYAEVAEGYRPGAGLAPFPIGCDDELEARGLQPTPTEYGSDSVTNYELGAKTNWLDSKLTLNASAFYIEWEDLQQTVFLDCGFRFTDNSGEASSKGLELEMSAGLTDAFSIQVAISYINSELEQDAVSLNAVSGDRLANVPKLNFSGSLDYRTELDSGNEIFANINAQYTGDAYFNYDFDDPSSKRDSYTLLNLSAGYEWDGFQLSAFVKNLTDKQAKLAIAESLVLNVPGRPRFVINRPRTIGLKLTKSF